MLPPIFRSAEWFVRSGIQEPDGGVARYYRTDLRQNAPVSTEITGYAVSALVWLGRLDEARRAARFLCAAWDPDADAMPFELGRPAYSYFFDNGIIVRGLLAAWRATRDTDFLDTAVAIGRHMARDFQSPDGLHPILVLPEKAPVERDPCRWSRSAGCYQLKSAMAWHDLAEATGEGCFRSAYDRTLDAALSSWRAFLPGHSDCRKVMDRLHAFSYFLEGMLPRAADPRCRETLAEGIACAAALLREIAPEFERSDVYAQILRARIYADRLGAVPLDRAAARCEAERLADFQAEDGGFHFGRADGTWLPYRNPVSTAFAAQALAMWAGEDAEVADLV